MKLDKLDECAFFELKWDGLSLRGEHGAEPLQKIGSMRICFQMDAKASFLKIEWDRLARVQHLANFPDELFVR
jgi:hypothetical protein